MPELEPQVNNGPLITQSIFDTALRKLAQGKATGYDGLPDTILKELGKTKSIKLKLMDQFNLWARRGFLPGYLTIAKVIPLSKDKDNSQFPAVGDVRTIAVLPALTKLYELCIYQLLLGEIQEHNLIDGS